MIRLYKKCGTEIIVDKLDQAAIEQYDINSVPAKILEQGFAYVVSTTMPSSLMYYASIEEVYAKLEDIMTWKPYIPPNAVKSV